MYFSDIGENMQFSFLVRKKREKLKLSQAEFAKRVGVSWITIWRWESGNGQPKPDALKYWIEKVEETI
jgi:DNA-binding transcriptional regulator YiaG